MWWEESRNGTSARVMNKEEIDKIKRLKLRKQLVSNMVILGVSHGWHLQWPQALHTQSLVSFFPQHTPVTQTAKNYAFLLFTLLREVDVWGFGVSSFFNSTWWRKSKFNRRNETRGRFCRIIRKWDNKFII